MQPPCRPITECTSQGGFQPWHIYEPGNRLGFLVSYFTDLHTTFAQTKETPFLHRDLYRSLPSTPRPLIAAYTALSAYAGRTGANKAWAIRAVCEGADEILRLADQNSAASTAVTKGHEKLACVQALWLLQTVRCFDGDVSLRAAAVRDMGVLNRWLKDLEDLRDNLDDMHLLDHIALRQKPPRSWEVWIFNECVRRTVFLGHLFTSLFEILVAAGDNSEYLPFSKVLIRILIVVAFETRTTRTLTIAGHQESDMAKWIAPHRWTFSKALWDAQSSPEFFMKWREKPILVITSFNVQAIAKVARPADIDEFARLFLTMLVSLRSGCICSDENRC